MKNLLIKKNRDYGDSATNPSNVFSSGSPVDSLCARIDDKLMRIQNKGINDKTEDTVSDLIGYLILLKVALHKDTKIVFVNGPAGTSKSLLSVYCGLQLLNMKVI